MAELEIIERFLNIDTANKSLRNGKKTHNKNKYYYYKNNYYIVSLTQGKWVVCSDDDTTRRLLNMYTWCLSHDGYAKTHTGNATKFWHQVYLLYQKPNLADHINNKRYDNRIENLRIVSPAENNRNKSKHKNNTSGKQGVSKCVMSGRAYWRVQIFDNEGKQIQKCYSINKYGDEAAKQLAIEKRFEWQQLYGYLGD